MYIADLLLETTVSAWGFRLPEPRISMGQNQDICKRLHRPLLHPSNGCGDIMVTFWKHPEPWEFWEPGIAWHGDAMHDVIPLGRGTCTEQHVSKVAQVCHVNPWTPAKNRTESIRTRATPVWLVSRPNACDDRAGHFTDFAMPPPKKGSAPFGALGWRESQEGLPRCWKGHSKVRWAAHLENSSQPVQ